MLVKIEIRFQYKILSWTSPYSDQTWLSGGWSLLSPVFSLSVSPSLQELTTLLPMMRWRGWLLLLFQNDNHDNSLALLATWCTTPAGLPWPPWPLESRSWIIPSPTSSAWATGPWIRAPECPTCTWCPWSSLLSTSLTTRKPPWPWPWPR